jgi:MFS family permease
MISERKTGPNTVLGLLIAINLFNYIDRQVLASVEPEIRHAFFESDYAHAMEKTGWLAPAFLVSYMISAPIFGWLADRMSRWIIIGAGVILWSVATAASGLAGTFMFLLITRLFVGVGEGAYGPAAPTIIADVFPLLRRGRAMSFFYVAIPVGSALGYAIGGFVASHWSWQTAFFVVAPPGLLMGIACFFLRDPRDDAGKTTRQRARLRDYASLVRIPSYILNTLAMTALTFAIGGLSFWVPGYLEYRGLPPSSRILFGGITVLAGLTATLLLIAFPFSALMLFTPFPFAWVPMFIAIFFLFFNTGPSNTALANVTAPSIRATAFAVNIFIIHALGDALAPPLIGAVADRTNMNVAFLVVSATMLFAGVLWLIAVKYLPRDTNAVESACPSPS